MTAADWQDADAHALGVFLNGRGDRRAPTTHGEPIVDRSFLLLLNAHYEDVTFTLPPRRFGRRWQVELSTALSGRAADGPDRPRRRARDLALAPAAAAAGPTPPAS